MLFQNAQQAPKRYIQNISTREMAQAFSTSHLHRFLDQSNLITTPHLALRRPPSLPPKSSNIFTSAAYKSPQLPSFINIRHVSENGAQRREHYIHEKPSLP